MPLKQYFKNQLAFWSIISSKNWVERVTKQCNGTLILKNYIMPIKIQLNATLLIDHRYTAIDHLVKSVFEVISD